MSTCTDLYGDLCVFVGQFEGIVEDFEVFLKGQGCPWEFLLVRLHKLCQLGWMIYEHQLTIILKKTNTFLSLSFYKA